MKQIVLFILLFFFVNVSWGQKYSFTLKGDIINVKDGKIQLFSSGDSVNVLLTTEMKDGLFILIGELEEPGFYILEVAGVRFPIVLDGKEMMLYGDYLQPDTKLLKGSPAAKTRLALDQLYKECFDMRMKKALEQYYSMTENGQKQTEEAEKFMGEAIREADRNWKSSFLFFVKTHPDDLYVPVRIMQEMRKSSELGKKGYEALTPKIQVSQPGRMLREMLEL